jgi:hypothetical protein
MAFKLHDSTLVDPHGGLTHLEKGELHWVGNYNERITEDPLRIMRYYITKVKYRLKDMPGYSNDTFTPFKKGLGEPSLRALVQDFRWLSGLRN